MTEPYKTLHDIIEANRDNLVDYFYHETLSPHASARGGLSPVPVECSNWRDEQRAWREAVLVFDQSHHMPETIIKGSDAAKLLSYVGINSFANFPPLRAKQYLGCAPDGHVIGECVLQHLEEGTYEMISGQFLQNWVCYNAEVGGYDVEITRDPATAWNPKGAEGRTFYRYELEGPHAQAVFDEICEDGAPEIKFFHMAKVKIAGCEVYALRHSVAGHKGVELSGPYSEGPRIMQAILAAGKKYGIRRAGLKTYFSTLGEVGWVGYPTPAIFTDPRLEDYRKWLPASEWEAQTQLGGSFRSDRIEDYYVTPWDLALEKLIKFDHDFIGRNALEKMAAEGGKRKKVTLVWNDEDIEKIFGSLLGEGTPYKFLEMPKTSYAFQQNDEVRTAAGNIVGVSNYVGYTVNEPHFLSVAFVDADFAETGTELILTWGEPDGGSRKPQVEKHAQTTVRVTVAPAPYAKHVRERKNAHMVKETA